MNPQESSPSEENNIGKAKKFTSIQSRFDNAIQSTKRRLDRTSMSEQSEADEAYDPRESLGSEGNQGNQKVPFVQSERGQN